MKVEFQAAFQPNGTYLAEVFDVVDMGEGSYGPFLIIEFTIVDKKLEGREFNFTVPFSAKLTPRTKLGRLVGAVFDEIEPGVEVDLDKLIGQHVKLDLVTEEGEQYDKIVVKGFSSPVYRGAQKKRKRDEVEEIPF